MKRTISEIIRRRRKPLTCEETGRRGGYARRNNLTPERRSEIARLGGLADGERRRRKLAAGKAAIDPRPKGAA